MKLYIFDLDGTLIDDMEFYRKIFSINLEELVRDRFGEAGVKTVENVRKANRGKGELALLVLGISYLEWFDRVTEDDIKLLSPRPELVEAIKKLDGIKVVFSGTDKKLVKRLLTRIGFLDDDFDEIIGFEAPAVVPIKLTADRLVFRYLLDKYKISPANAFMFGDEYEFDLLPAMSLGINAVEVRHRSGKAEHFLHSLTALPEFLKSTFGKTTNEKRP